MELSRNSAAIPNTIHNLSGGKLRLQGILLQPLYSTISPLLRLWFTLLNMGSREILKGEKETLYFSVSIWKTIMVQGSSTLAVHKSNARDVRRSYNGTELRFVCEGNLKYVKFQL